MKVLLEGLLPRVFPGLNFLCVPHEGKQDLEKSVPRKLRAWREPGVRFVIVRDNDSGDCRAHKRRLVALCREAGHDDALVRIACQELESWYLGDSNALCLAFGDERLRSIVNKARYRDPDSVQQPSNAIESLVPAFQKVSGARRMSAHMSRDDNRSASFQAFIAGLARVESELP